MCSSCGPAIWCQPMRSCVSAVTLSVDQAALTGESLPVEKHVGDGPEASCSPAPRLSAGWARRW